MHLDHGQIFDMQTGNISLQALDEMHFGNNIQMFQISSDRCKHLEIRLSDKILQTNGKERTEDASTQQF